MGYTTDFDGGFKLSRELAAKEVSELDELSQYDDEVYKKYNSEFPNSYNQWILSHDNSQIEWNGYEKFYDYVEWLKWLIENYFKPRDIVLNGKSNWSGEEIKDIGVITVKDNEVTSQEINVEGLIECPYCHHEFIIGEPA